MIAEYIEKIVVHEADKSSGERQQQVVIYVNFIDKFEVPMPKPTAEEIATEEKLGASGNNAEKRNNGMPPSKSKKSRRARTGQNACKRMGLFESLIPDTISLTDEQFKIFLENNLEYQGVTES